jgi:hypothetical protein
MGDDKMHACDVLSRPASLSPSSGQPTARHDTFPPQHAVTCTPPALALTLTTTTTTTLTRPTPPLPLPLPPPSHGGLSCASVPSLVLPSQPCRPLHHLTAPSRQAVQRSVVARHWPVRLSFRKRPTTRQQAIEGSWSTSRPPNAHPTGPAWPARGICTAPSGWERITPRALYPRFDNYLAHSPICTNRQPRLVLGTPTRTPCSVRLHLRLAALVRPRFLELILAGAPLASPLPLCSSPSLPKLSFLMPAGPVASSLDMFVH